MFPAAGQGRKTTGGQGGREGWRKGGIDRGRDRGRGASITSASLGLGATVPMKTAGWRGGKGACRVCSNVQLVGWGERPGWGGQGRRVMRRWRGGWEAYDGGDGGGGGI